MADNEGTREKGGRKRGTLGGRLAKKPRVSTDDQDSPPREFEHVHSEVVLGKTTIVLTPNGLMLSLYPSNDSVHTLDRNKLTWDFLANMTAANSGRTGPAVTLKDCFLALSKDSIDYISLATKYGWGFMSEPITEQHQPIIGNDTAMLLTGTLVASGNPHQASICRLMAENILTDRVKTMFTGNAYVELNIQLRRVIRTMWTKSLLPDELAAIKENYKPVLLLEPQVKDMFDAAVQAGENDRYTRVMEIIQTDRPFNDLYEIGDFANICDFMMRSPSKNLFESFAARRALKQILQESNTESQRKPPPRIQQLLEACGKAAKEHGGARGKLLNICDVGNVAQEQMSVVAGFLDGCSDATARYIFKTIDPATVPDDELIQDICKGNNELHPEVLDEKLREIHETHRLAGEYSKIEWRRVFDNTYDPMKQLLDAMIVSYINESEITMKVEGENKTVKYTSIAKIVGALVRALFLSQDDFDHFKTIQTGSKALPMDRKFADECKSLDLIFDQLHQDTLKEIAEMIYYATLRLPELMRFFYSKCAYYVQGIRLDHPHIFSRILSEVTDVVIKSAEILRPYAKPMARDLIYILFRAFGHEKTGTFSQFREAIALTMPLRSNDTSIIYTRSDDEENMNIVDTSGFKRVVFFDDVIIDDVITVDEPLKTDRMVASAVATTEGEAGSKSLAGSDVNVSATDANTADGGEGGSKTSTTTDGSNQIGDRKFKVVIHSALAKDTEGLSTHAIAATILARMGDSVVCMDVETATGQKATGGDNNREMEMTGAAKILVGGKAKPVPKQARRSRAKKNTVILNEFITKDAKKEIGNIKQSINAYSRKHGWDGEYVNKLKEAVETVAQTAIKPIEFMERAKRMASGTKLIGNLTAILEAVALSDMCKRELERAQEECDETQRIWDLLCIFANQADPGNTDRVDQDHADGHGGGSSGEEEEEGDDNEEGDGEDHEEEEEGEDEA